MTKARLLIAAGMALVAAGVAGSMRHAPPRRPHAATRATTTAPPASTFLIRNARVFDGERLVERTSVLVESGTIAAVGPDVTAPAGTDTIDAPGRTLLPGLIDAHAHAFGDALPRALVFGVTTELDMFTDHRQAAQWRAEQRSPAEAPAFVEARIAPFQWAGAMFSPGPAPMAPADLSRFQERVFWARGDGRQYHVLVFATHPGNAPAAQSFTAGPDWREVVLPLAGFSGMDGRDVTGLLFSADGTAGAFRFAIDAVRLRRAHQALFGRAPR